MKNILFSSLIGSLCISAASGAPQRRATSVLTVSGRCAQLTVEGHDVTDRCQPVVANIDWADGKMTLTFSFGDNYQITFSGNGHDQIHPTSDSAVQPVDTIYTAVDGKPSLPRHAAGSCRFASPWSGHPVEIACRSQTDWGVSTADFITDGRAPVAAPIK